MNPTSHTSQDVRARFDGAAERAAGSLALIRSCELHADDAILEVSAGDPGLIDALLAEGFRDITVIDPSSAALEALRAQLGERGDRVVLLRADPLHFRTPRRFALWHDCSLFQHLEYPEERQQYIEVAQQVLRPEGHLVLLSPGRTAELGRQFELLGSAPAPGRSATGSPAALHCRFRRHAPTRLSA